LARNYLVTQSHEHHPHSLRGRPHQQRVAARLRYGDRLATLLHRLLEPAQPPLRVAEVVVRVETHIHDPNLWRALLTLDPGDQLQNLPIEGCRRFQSPLHFSLHVPPLMEHSHQGKVIAELSRSSERDVEFLIPRSIEDRT